MPRKGSLSRKNRDSQSLTKDNRVFLYIRASTPEQVNSLDVQAAAAARFAARHELNVEGTETDAGVSAIKHGFRDRPGAQRMFRTMKARGIRTILVLRVDRAFRSSLDFSQTLAWCRDEGFTFRFIDPDIDLGSPIGEMFIQIQVALAQMECDIRSSRVDGALDSLRSHRLARNANTGTGHGAPYGWRAVPCEDGTTTRQGHHQFRHIPIPAEQAILRHLLQLWQANPTHGALTRLAATMNDLRVPTKIPTGTPFTRTYHKGTPREVTRTFTASGTWYPATVKSVLEHALLATDAELLDGIPSLDHAIAILNHRPPTASPSHQVTASNLLPSS